MTCREFADFLADHLERRLPSAVARRFEHHLSICPDCSIYLRNYRTTVELARLAERGDDAVPEDVPVELVEAVLRSRLHGT